ncbi:hypothetical protein M885DRAFT_504957 [Pelagophyceae sp. CCMP2097]|nr:hypothetical protein M885DRAFT_504957 [Pelagophyceae sp. CCMP2097]
MVFFTFIIAGMIGAGFARLTVIMFDLIDDDESRRPENLQARIDRVDTVMIMKSKPEIVVAPPKDSPSGVYVPERWPIETMFSFSSAAAEPMAPEAAKEVEMSPSCHVHNDSEPVPLPAKPEGWQPHDCYICFDRLADSLFLPCGHAGVCYKCAIENVARADTCPCCRVVVQQVISYDRDKPTMNANGLETFRVVGPVARPAACVADDACR